MAGPGDEIAAGAGGRGHLRASHADCEQVIEALKAAFVQGRLDKDEFDRRVGQAFASRTYAELAAVTADLPAGLTTAKPPTPARAQGEAVIPRPGIVLAVATVIYTGMWALAFLLPNGADGEGAGAVFGIATMFYLIVVIFAGAQLLESRQKERSGGHSPRRPTAGAGGQASQRLPSADPDRQLPPDHRASPLVRRRRPRAIDVPLAHRHDEAGGEARARADLYG